MNTNRSPQEWAQILAGQLKAKTPQSQIDVQRIYAAVFQDAIEAERERCAEIADSYDVPCDPRTEAEQSANEIAARIRRG